MVVSAVRHSPDGMIVRVYETEGRAAPGVTLRLAARLAEASETNLIEKEARPVQVEPDGRSLRFDIGPFEIKTFRLNASLETP